MGLAEWAAEQSLTVLEEGTSKAKKREGIEGTSEAKKREGIVEVDQSVVMTKKHCVRAIPSARRSCSERLLLFGSIAWGLRSVSVRTPATIISAPSFVNI
jgi:hypothetical protein